MNWRKTFRVLAGVIALGTVVGLGLWIGKAARERATLCVSFKYPSFYESEELGHQLGFSVGVELENARGSMFPFFDEGLEHQLADKNLGIDESLGEHYGAIEREAVEAGWSKFQFSQARVYSGLKVGKYKAEVYLLGCKKPFVEQWIEVEKEREFRLIELPRLRSIIFQIEDWEVFRTKVVSNGSFKVVCEILDKTGNYLETSFDGEAKGGFSLNLVDGVKYRIWLVSEVGSEMKHWKGIAFVPKDEPTSPGLPFGDDVFLTPEGGRGVQELPKFD